MWTIQGYDTFSSEWYPIRGAWETEEQAQAVAAEVLVSLERRQPTSTSGGQAVGGIQDRVFIVRPDGTIYRMTLSEIP